MVGVISEDRLSAIPTTHHMENGSLVLNSRLPWHTPRATRSGQACQYSNPDPFSPNGVYHPFARHNGWHQTR